MMLLSELREKHSIHENSCWKKSQNSTSEVLRINGRNFKKFTVEGIVSFDTLYDKFDVFFICLDFLAISGYTSLYHSQGGATELQLWNPVREFGICILT